ncbi:T9SS type A sorting domain-containing protein [Fulvivirgaceae bacterium BMA12]|uniref:T9SS type A sorting domain-containing protein n=1 Tax=Agaribacillus aureus TaxID=3051825 RepID=A0ABT8L2V3_9BACT|nr:T9SS type A sorting domain-containing protein [Fulvivirgaceae bacterium BMA12]
MRAIFLSLIAVGLSSLGLAQEFPISGWPTNQHDVSGLVAFNKAKTRDEPVNSTSFKKDTIKWSQVARYHKSITRRKPEPKHFRAQNRSEMARIAAQTGRTGLSIYPDPGEEIAALDLKPDEVFQVVISDLSGNELLRKINPCSIDFSQFHRGVYLLEIMTSSGFSRMRVIKR